MSAETIESLTNEKISVRVEKKPGCKVVLHVHTESPQLLEEAKKRAIKHIAKEVAIPGFRKGKVPAQVVEQKYPESVAQNQRKQLADLLLVEAIVLSRVSILNNNSPVNFDVKSLDANHADFLFTYETEPSVPKVDPTQFKPQPLDEKKVSEKEVDEAIHQMRFFFADWKPVTDRPVQEKDYVLLDIDSLEKEEPERVFSQLRFEVSLDRMAHWMYHLILGKKTGESVDGISAPNEDAPDIEKQAFEPKKVRCTIFKIEEAKLPELDDAFAKQVGVFSMDEVRASVRRRLEAEVSRGQLHAKREQVNQFLIDTYPFELPQSIVDAEFAFRKEQFLNHPQGKRTWDKMSQEKREEWESMTREEAKRAICAFYLTRNILLDANIPVTHKEIESTAIRMVSEPGHPPVDPSHLSKETMALASSKLFLEKAQDYILQTSSHV